MNKIFLNFNNFFSNFEALGSLLLRLGVGIAFILYGLGKFPLPPEGLTEYFNLSPFIASLVAISELSTGIILIISHFLKNSIGHTLTRLAGLNIVVLMMCIFVKSSLVINQSLCATTNMQIIKTTIFKPASLVKV